MNHPYIRISNNLSNFFPGNLIQMESGYHGADRVKGLRNFFCQRYRQGIILMGLRRVTAEPAIIANGGAADMGVPAGLENQPIIADGRKLIIQRRWPGALNQFDALTHGCPHDPNG